MYVGVYLSQCNKVGTQQRDLRGNSVLVSPYVEQELFLESRKIRGEKNPLESAEAVLCSGQFTPSLCYGDLSAFIVHSSQPPSRTLCTSVSSRCPLPLCPYLSSFPAPSSALWSIPSFPCLISSPKYASGINPLHSFNDSCMIFFKSLCWYSTFCLLCNLRVSFLSFCPPFCPPLYPSLSGIFFV